MAGKSKAEEHGKGLEERVADLGRRLGLKVRTRVRVGKRLWGGDRILDVVMARGTARLGLECKYQKERGTAEQKIPATLKDMEAWPIPGLIVFDGPGFSPNMRAYLLSTGKAVEMEDLEEWVRLFFAIDDE